MTKNKTGKRARGFARSAEIHEQTACPLCQQYPRYNKKTLAAFKEADEIMSQINSGERKGQTLEEFFAELVAL